MNPKQDLYRLKGLAEQKNGRYQEALNFYLKAASLGPESPVLDNDIGIIYEQVGSTQRAEEYYLRVLKIDGNYLPAYSNLAYLYLDQGQTQKAKEFFLERLKRSRGNDPWKEKIRQELYEIDPSFKANAIKQQLEETDRRLAQEAQQKQRAEFTLSIERAQAHYKRAQSFRAGQQYQQALSELNQALKITPDNPKLLDAKKQVEYEERIDEVKQKISAAADQLKSGQVDCAKKEFQQILAILPKEPISKSEN